MKGKDLITKILKRKDIILLVIIAIAGMLFLHQCNRTSHFKSELSIQSLNVSALEDSVRAGKNRLGEVTYAKKILIAEKNTLEELNSELKIELKNAKGKVIIIEKVKTIIITDTIYVTNTVTEYPGGLYSLNWNFDSIYSPGNYRELSGNSFFRVDSVTGKIIPDITRVNNSSIGFSFITGIREKDGALEIFITPKYPGMKITGIEGAIIDPWKSDVLKSVYPQKNWAIGPYAGIGIGITEPILRPVFSVGISIQRTWIRF